MTESEFTTIVDRLLLSIGEALDGAQTDFDWSLVDGVLDIECPDGSKLIINRHGPNREIWVAAKRGGFHYRAREGRWVDTRGGEELGVALRRFFSQQGGGDVELPWLSAE